MARENQTQREALPQLSYDWNLLGNAQVAGQYLQQGEQGLPYARKSLELILSDAKINDPWLVNTVTDPEVLPKTIGNQLKMYNQFKGRQTVGDLLNHYSADFSKYLGENAEEALKELETFAEEEYGDILKQIGKAKHILDGREKYGMGSDEEVENAKKLIEKYQKIPQTIGLLEGLSAGRFRTRVEEEMTKDNLRALYVPKEGRE